MFAQANATFGFFQYIPWASESQDDFALLECVLLTHRQAFSALRAYALSEHLPLAIITLILAMVSFGINLVRFIYQPLVQSISIVYHKGQFGFGLTGLNDPTFGCSTGVNIPLELSKKSVF